MMAKFNTIWDIRVISTIEIVYSNLVQKIDVKETYFKNLNSKFEWICKEEIFAVYFICIIKNPKWLSNI